MNRRRRLLDRSPTGTLRSLAAAVLATIALAAAGCASSSPSPEGSGAAGPAPAPDTPDRIDPGYIVGPREAAELGYRVDWQSLVDARGGIRHLSIQEDAIFVLDGENFLSRMRRVDGRRVWRVPVGRATTEINGVVYVAPARAVYVVAGGDLLEIDAGTGAQTGRQKLDKIANTTALLYGPFLIYGSRNGQIVWHNYSIAYQWRAYQVAGAIQVQPVVAGRYLVAAGTGGTVMVLSAGGEGQLWSKKMLDEVTAPPAVGGDVVYVSSKDQILRAFDLYTGRKLWDTLTASPLTDGPVLLGSDLYQNVPGEGLHCFEAKPRNSRRGVVRWVNEAVEGRVVTEHAGNVMVWSEREQLLHAVERGGGAVAASIPLDRVARLDTQGGEIVAVADDGRLVRLIPRGGGAAAASASGP
jgi:hypothetical protein